MMELAVFGSLMLLVLAALVNYGLTADATQRTMMEAFRQSLAGAAQTPLDNQPSQLSPLVLRDYEVSSPSHPFGLGSVAPSSASPGGVQRNYHQQETPDTIDELPRIRMVVNGEEFDCPSAGMGCVTAGFRDEADVGGYKLEQDAWINDPDAIGPVDRYQQVYDSASFVDQGAGSCPGCRNLRIIDRCEGEIFGYDDCVSQARLIVDDVYCARQCERGKAPGSLVDCAAVCHQPMNRPWYAQDASQDANGQWNFPKIEQLFTASLGADPSAKTPISTLGLQAQRDSRRFLVAELAKQEDGTGVTTTSTFAPHLLLISRPFVYHALNDDSGVATVEIKTQAPVDDQSSTTWQTPWK